MPVDIEAKVIRNTRLSSDYNVIALAAPEIAATVAPGQFVMVKPGRCNDPLLRRPFSVFEILRENGVTILPDILANAGGVTVSYFEWVQGLQNFFWDKKRVEDELQKIMEKSFDEVNAKADASDVDYRTAAYTIAVGRVAEAVRLKGLFP